MKQKESLFRLIHSLDKYEKRFFKLSASIQGGEKLYMQVFDSITRQSEYNPEDICRKLGIKRSLLAEMKVYLERLLLNSMASLYSSPEAEVRKLLTQAEFLHGKGLYSHHAKILNKAKNLASDYDSDTHLFEILNMEHQNAWRKRDPNQAKKAMEEDKKILGLFNNKRQYRHLSNEILLALSKTGAGRNLKEAKK